MTQSTEGYVNVLQELLLALVGFQGDVFIDNLAPDDANSNKWVFHFYARPIISWNHAAPLYGVQHSLHY